MPIFAPNEKRGTHITIVTEAECPTPLWYNLFFSPNLGTEEWALVACFSNVLIFHCSHVPKPICK